METSVTPEMLRAAASISKLNLSRIGQAAIVKSTFIFALPFSITAVSTMPSSVIDLLNSGSITLESESKRSCDIKVNPDRFWLYSQSF